MGRRISRMLMAVAVLWAQSALAATRYIDDNGNDGNSGASNIAPWKTWSKAFGSSACGDTLIVMDGTYTLAVHGVPVLTKICTASTVFTVQAENSRKAYLSSNGSNYGLRVLNSAYYVIDGLRVGSADNNCCAGNNYGNVELYNSPNGTVKNLLIHNNNRYQNTALLRVQLSNDIVVEGNELYSFHRHGLQIGGDSNRAIVRRNYCNSRGYADIPGGFVSSAYGPRGDSCIIVYPTGGTTVTTGIIVENNISEGNGAAYWAETYLGPHGTKWYGNISLSDSTGYLFKARGSTLAQQPYQNDIRDTAIITPVSVGIQLRGNRDTTITNATIYDSSGNSGLSVDIEEPQVGSGIYGFTATNVISTLNTTGFFVSETPTWSIVNANGYSNSTNFNPASSTFYTPSNPPSSLDPQIGTCRVWRPDGSTAKLNNWGADILYRYQDGVLTNTPLWDTVTGAFPFGAIVIGINDVGGSSLFDVHSRLNVNSGGCSFPAGFGSEPSPQTTLTQVRFRIEEFNGPERNPTLKAAENTNYTVQVGGCARIRLKVTADASVSAGPRGFVIWAAPNGGAYAALTDSFVGKVKFSGVGNDTIAEGVTTEQMTDDQPTYTAGPIVRSATQTIQIEMGPNYDTELIALVCIQDTAVPGTDFWDFKIRQVDPTTQTVSDLDVYSAIPRLTTKRMAAGAL